MGGKPYLLFTEEHCLVLSGSQSKHCLSLGGSSTYFYFHCDPSKSLSLLNSVIALNVRIEECGGRGKQLLFQRPRRWDGNYTSGLAPWGCFSGVFSPAPCPDFVFSWAITSCSYLAVSPSAGYLHYLVTMVSKRIGANSDKAIKTSPKVWQLSSDCVCAPTIAGWSPPISGLCSFRLSQMGLAWT